MYMYMRNEYFTRVAGLTLYTEDGYYTGGEIQRELSLYSEDRDRL